MEMYRIKCEKCLWTTNPHYSVVDCIKDKERDHKFGIKENGYDAHESSFGKICPKCGCGTIEEYRFFPEDEIKNIQQARIYAR